MTKNTSNVFCGAKLTTASSLRAVKLYCPQAVAECSACEKLAQVTLISIVRILAAHLDLAQLSLCVTFTSGNIDNMRLCRLAGLTFCL